MFEMNMNIIISAFIGICFRDIKTVLLFLAMYIPLRTYCGGWHADEIWKCTVISSLILVVAEIFANYFLQYISVISCLPIVVICSVLILAVSPVDTESKPLSEAEKRAYKKKAHVIMAIQICILLFMIIMKYEKNIIVIEYVYLIQVLMLLIEKIRKML